MKIIKKKVKIDPNENSLTKEASVVENRKDKNGSYQKSSSMIVQKQVSFSDNEEEKKNKYKSLRESAKVLGLGTLALGGSKKTKRSTPGSKQVDG